MSEASDIRWSASSRVGRYRWSLMLAVLLVPSVWTEVVWAQEPSTTSQELAVPAASADDGARAEARALGLREVSDRLICQCSCNMILSECNHQSCPFALPERRNILAELDAGVSQDAIVAGYVERYGREILSAPPTDGGFLDRLAWLMPFIALGAGLLAVVYFLRVFTRRGRESAPPAASTAVEEFRERIERELEGGSGRTP